MCMMIAKESLNSWLATQERMMRAWIEEAALDPNADQSLLERLEAHCTWLRGHAELVGATTAAEDGRRMA